MQSKTTIAVALALIPHAWAQSDVYLPPPNPAALGVLYPSSTIFPITNNGTSLRIPDFAQTLAFLFRDLHFEQAPSDQIKAFLNQQIPLTEKSKALYDVDRILGADNPAPTPDLLTNVAEHELGIRGLSFRWTTLAGVSNWALVALSILISYRCDCDNQPLMPVYNSTARNPIEREIQFVPSPGQGQNSSILRGPGCSPRVFAQGRLRYVIDNGQLNLDAEPSPIIQDPVLAQFNMIVDTLRNATAIALLESIPVNGSHLFNVMTENDEIGKRVVKAAGLPATAISNMRGFLTIRQYALYQALVRGDHDCPVPETDCGVNGPDRCDEYPPKR